MNMFVVTHSRMLSGWASQFDYITLNILDESCQKCTCSESLKDVLRVGQSIRLHNFKHP